MRRGRPSFDAGWSVADPEGRGKTTRTVEFDHRFDGRFVHNAAREVARVLRVLQMGLGPIGRAMARRVHQHAAFELTGAVDPEPALAGRDLGDVLRGDPLGLEVESSAERAIERASPDVVLHSTGSFLAEVADQLRPLVDRGLVVVSTCEELAYPFYRHPDLARELDERARASGAVLLGTGINPGFVMDKFVATLMAACASVRTVRVTRVVDAATRRESFQRKIGAGLAPAEFERRKAAGRMGHVGLAESAHMLADVMGAGPRRDVHEELRPVLAERGLFSDYLKVEVGQVAGIDQTAVLEDDGVQRVRLELKMFLGAKHPRDDALIEGSPPLGLAIPSGLPGDEGTIAVALNSARLARALAPGLRTMLDVPLRLCP